MSFPGFHHVWDPDAKRRSEQRGKAILKEIFILDEVSSPVKGVDRVFG